MKDPAQTTRDQAHGQMAERLAEVAGVLVQVRDTALLSQRIVEELRAMFRTQGVML